MKKVLLIDAFGIIFRSYYAFISRPLTNKNGENVSAVFGFFKSIVSIIKTQKPDEILIALEGKGECFRNKIYPQYKANRSETPDDLKSQIIKIIDLIEEFNIPHFFKEGYEADDIIATLCDVYEKKGDSNIIVFSSDKDLRQLVSEQTVLCRPDPKSQNNIVYDIQKIYDDMGIYPNQVADYLALTGDTSDNIPGVPGVGDKTAVALLQKWHSLDGIYEHIDEVTPAGVQKKLRDNKEFADLSKKLTVVERNISLDIDEDTMKIKPFETSIAFQTLLSDGMNGLIEDIKALNILLGGSGEISSETIGKKLPFEQFIYIENEDQLHKCVDGIKLSKVFAFDLETTGFDFFNDRIICMSIAFEKNTYVLPFNSDDNKETIDLLKPIFSDNSILKIGHNIKFDFKFLYSAGIREVGNIYDTMIAEYSVDSGNNAIGLKDLGAKYFSYVLVKYEDLIKEYKVKDLTQIPTEKLIEYAGQDAYVTYELFVHQKKYFEDERASKIYNTIESPLISVLTDMEYTGIAVNEEHLTLLSASLEIKIEELYKEMSEMSGETFNPNSPLQLREILFGRFGLPVVKKTKTGPSTDVDVLTKLSDIHPFPDLLLKHRTLTKIKTTYSDPLPRMINPATGRIHTTYMQTGTQTGRLSSKDPNLQNIPIRNEIGREIRKSFIPAKDHVLISADYSQIEIFLLAEFSKDEILCDALQNNIDIHSRTAALLFNTTMEEVTKQERNAAKTVNFGILYGQSAFTLAGDLKISRTAANEFIEKYFQHFHGVKDYIDLLKQRCHETGYAETHWGRRRSIPEIYEKNKMVRDNGERMAVNTVIQGTAADLIKLAMCRIHNVLRGKGLSTKLLLQVHDELVFEAPIAEKDIVIPLIKNEMEEGYGFSLKLKTAVEIGKTWGDMH